MNKLYDGALVLAGLSWAIGSAQAQESPPEWLALAGRSTAVVVGAPLGPEWSVEFPNERTPRLVRDGENSYTVIPRDPAEYVVGELRHFRVLEVVKGDGRVAPTRVIDVFHEGQLREAVEGRRYLLFLRAPIVRGADPIDGWRSLVGALLTRPDAPESPFDPSGAYSVVLVPQSHALPVLELSDANAAEVQAILDAIQANAQPLARIVAPVAGAMLRKDVTLAAAASDDVGVLGVQFRVDGVNLGSEVLPDDLGTVAATWDTRSVADGPHELAAEARDTAGNRAGSVPVLVTVDNTAPDVRLTPLPASLGPHDDRLVPVVIDVMVTDAQDTGPTVELQSITCAQARFVRNGAPNRWRPCNSPDVIVGATVGTDDREFQLRTSPLRPRSIRVYTIAYSARDAAGNTVTVTTTVSVEAPGS